MAESSLFWQTNGTGDGTDTGYTQAQMFEWLRSFFAPSATNLGGVAPDYQNKLAVSGTSSPASVATGAALVYGIPYVNTAAVNVAIPTPSGATRIDRIVLRADYTAQTVRITRIAGTEGGAAPSLTQSAGTTWDVPLAQASITTAGVVTVTDQREWLSLVGDGAVTTAKIGTGAVTEAKLGTAAVATAKIANDAVTADKIGPGAVDATALGTGAVNASKLASDAVETAKIKDANVTEAKLATGAVTEAKIGTGAVTAGKLGTSAVTESKISSAAVTGTKIATGAVSTDKLANDCITVDQAGAGLPVLIKRQGGSSTNWGDPGTTTYTPGAVRMQAGVVAGTADGTTRSITISFPEDFSYLPIVLITPLTGVSATPSVFHVQVVSVGAAIVYYNQPSGSIHIHWLAIGPE